MKILAIETSCDETAVAVTEGRKILANTIYSQVLIHKEWGGVVPSLAKRAHEERIDFVIAETLRKFARTNHLRRNFSFIQEIDAIAVTYGPGLAVALEVGIAKAKELSKKYKKKLIAVDHMEGHIYSCFAQNSKGNPNTEFDFPYLALLVSGGHTQIVLFKDHISYETLGETIDDAAGEALDKAAKMLGLGYPGGPVIEKLASQVRNVDLYHFPRPMLRSDNLNFSFSGLKTAFYYFLKKQSEQMKIAHMRELASAFQEATFDSIITKTEKAMRQTEISKVVVGGGVSANRHLRHKLRRLTKKYKGEVLFPTFSHLTGDNAAMIGVAAHFKSKKDIYVKNIDTLDRVPRLRLG